MSSFQSKLRQFQRGPYVTYSILTIQVIIFILMTFSGGTSSLPNLIRFGAKINPLIQAGQWWRLVTPMFIHFSFMHLLFNSLIIYFLGRQLESIYGHWRYFLLYMLSGIAGNVLSFAFNHAISAGASTAVFGLFAAAVVLGRLNPGNPYIQSMGQSYLTLIIINLIFNIFSPGVDLAGHLGGLVGGALTAPVLAPTHARLNPQKRKMLFSAIYLVGFLGFYFYGMSQPLI